jgi:hypothetical protein
LADQPHLLPGALDLLGLTAVSLGSLAKFYELIGAGRKLLRKGMGYWNRLATAIGSALAAQLEKV